MILSDGFGREAECFLQEDGIYIRPVKIFIRNDNDT